MGGLGVRLAPFYLKKRLARGKEDPLRVGERFGIAGKARPNGPLIWLHGASVGESVAALSVVAHLKKHLPHVTYLFTSGTKTSASLLEARMEEGMIHQYLPLDAPAWTQAFLNHWRPDLALWMESELWPGLLMEAYARQVPLVLLNARMSPKSLKRWQYLPQTFKRIMGCFRLILTQTKEQKDAFTLAGAQHAHVGGNIKFATAPLSWDGREAARLRDQLSGRPFWVAASTHEGEEALVCEAHRRLKETIPDLLTILIPRHPERAKRVQDLAHTYGQTCLRSTGAPITQASDFYLVDTLGEMGLFFHLSPLVFLGGSLTPIGGHNLIEPANLSCALLVGPHMFKQEEIMYHFREGDGYIEVTSVEEMVANVYDLLQNKERCLEWAQKALNVATTQRAHMDHVWHHLTPFTEALAC